MKQSTHSHAPASPVPRKLRSDSKLSSLSPDVQSLLLKKLETQSYQETASWLQDTHRISVSPSNLSTFRSRHFESEALKEAYLQSATFHCTLQDLKVIDPGDAQVEAAVRRLFLFKVVNQGDIATYLHFTRVGNESKKLALTQAREARLQQERQEAHSDSEDQDLFTSTNLASSPLLPSLSSLNPTTGPLAPRAQSPIGVGTSRPHTMPQDSNHSKTDPPIPSPKAPCFDSASQPSEVPIPPTSPTPLPPANMNPSDPAPPPATPNDLLDSFQQALDAVMPLDGSEPVAPSSLDPFYATIISTVIGRMLDLVQSGKFLPVSSSSTAQSAPALNPQPGATTPSQKANLSSSPIHPVSPVCPEGEESLVPSSPSLPSNSLKYPKTPSIPRAKIFLPDRPASEPTSRQEIKDATP